MSALSASALARRREIARVWNLLTPKPMELRKGRRRFLREGPLQQWSDVQKRVKKKYIFLFSDCLIITRKDSPQRCFMKIFCFLNSIKDIQAVPGQAYSKIPDVEFRMITPKKTLIFFAASKSEAETWIRDLNYAREGCKGPPPPSVLHYGDEAAVHEQQEEEIEISEESAAEPAMTQFHESTPEHPAAQVPSVQPEPAAQPAPQSATSLEDLLLIDFSVPATAHNPFAPVPLGAQVGATVAGYPAQQIPGYPAQQIPGYPAQQIPGYPAQQIPGYPAQQIPGYPAQQIPGQPIAYDPSMLVYPAASQFNVGAQPPQQP